MRNLTLYRSQAGRNAEPHALPVTSRKEHGTSTYHTLYRGATPEGRRNLSQAPRFASSKYGEKRTPR
ncbi:hypothetical protein ACSBR2_029247 [Camellia fascicularis]